MNTYKKILEMESVVLLKLQQDKKALEKIRKKLYWDKSFIVGKLIQYLEKDLGVKYYHYEIIDEDYNFIDLLVKEDSDIFKKEINGNDFLNYNIENLINKKYTNNTDEIIIIGINSENNYLNLQYLCDSLSYKFLSYSDNLKEKLNTFTEYVLSKNM